jgi:TusE/DsrC/DsvC family sulfur relay protein
LPLDQPAEAAHPVQNGTQQVRSIAGREMVFDSEGFLLDPHQWMEEVAEDLAGESGVTDLTATHWRVIRFLREYYLQNGRAPLHRQLKSGTDLSLMEIESLFPGGIKYGARRLAGLPNPRSCGM